MKKLDRYILSRYLLTFFFCIMLMTVIVVVVDISEKTDDFVKSNLSAWEITRDYYFGFIPRIDAMLFPLFVFIAVIFFTSKLAGRSEIIAILSSGVSFRRFLRPYLIGGTLLAALLWLGYQYFVPQANRKWADFEKRYIDVNSAPTANSSTYKQNIYFKDDASTYIGIKGYDTISRNGNVIFLCRYEGNKMVYNLRAAGFNWDTATRRWKMRYVIERNLKALTEDVRFNETKFMQVNFRPIDLRKDDYLKDQMTTPDLDHFIEAEKRRGSEMLNALRVERYNRDAIPFSVLVLTIIGAVLASRKVRGGSGMHLALGFVISVLYILFSRFTIVFATKGNFTPWLAAWTPNILFGILAVYLYRRAPK